MKATNRAVLSAMLGLSLRDHFASSAAEIRAEARRRRRHMADSTVRRSLRRLEVDAMVVEWGPLPRSSSEGIRGPRPMTWQLTAEGKQVAQEQDLP